MDYGAEERAPRRRGSRAWDEELKLAEAELDSSLNSL